MREIKFRGFHEETGRWVYGSLLKIRVGSGYSPAIEYFEDNGHLQTILVNPVTISQYIGILGKNDKEIYEDDIVEFEDLYMTDNQNPDKLVGVIIFRNGSFLISLGIENNMISSRYLHENIRNLQVVGNIYENPELLQG